MAGPLRALALGLGGGAKPPAAGSGAFGDAYLPQAREAEGPPWWVVAMTQDRMLGVQALGPEAQRQARALEQAWVKGLAEAAGAWLPTWPWPVGAPSPIALGLAQAVAERLVGAAWPAAPKPRVRLVPGLRRSRGQYLFDLEGGLIQLAPAVLAEGPGGLGTLAHECYHHLQQALVGAHYRGATDIPPHLRAIAAWHRDARAAYRPKPEDPEAHQGQGLELGAEAYGRAIALWRPEGQRGEGTG